MSEELIKYDCRNCGHWVVTKLRVEGGAKCKECGSVPMDQRLISNGIQEEKVEHKDVLEVLSKFTTEELIEALKQKEDVQINNTTKETWAIKYDLTKVKKYCLLINNCDVNYIESCKRYLEAEQLFWNSRQ